MNVSTDTQSVTDVLLVNLESGVPAAADVHVTLALNNTLVDNYNTTNSLTGQDSIRTLDPSTYTVPLTLTIPKGSRNAQVTIEVPTTTPLDPNLSYGLGFTIASVDGGYVIADNLKNLLLIFNIKNKYDGKYELTGYHNRTPYTFPYDVTVAMVTTGASSVAMFLYAPFNDFGHPIGTAPGQINWYGTNVSPNFIFDPTTNEATGINLEVGTAVTLGYVIDPSVHNYYDPATKTMYLEFEYNGNDLRRFYDTLKYIGPR